jgi:hypothetical protein
MVLSLPRGHKETPEERGAIIVLFALCLVPMIAFIALAIDVSRMAESSSKAKASVGFASLAGLESYYTTKVPAEKTDPNEVHKYRLEKAIDRVEELLALTESSNIGTSGAALTETGQHEFKEGSGALTSRTADISGVVTPGQWFFSEPSVGCANYVPEGGGEDTQACPCQGATKKWDKQCFRAAGANDTIVTAMKVDYHTKSHNGISTAIEATFSRVLGVDSINFGVSTIAAIAPRALAFSIDNSRSMTFGNFTPYSDLTTFREASEYVYPLNVSDPECAGDANPCTAEGLCNFTGDSASLYRVLYNTMVADGPRPVSPLKGSSVHYYDDYKCFNIDNNGEQERYLIATKIGYDVDEDGDGAADGKFNGPEPLNSVLQGIYTVTQSLEKISVAGDKIIAFSFDDRTPNDLTSMDEDKRRVFGPTSVGNDDFNNLKRIVKVEGQTDDDVKYRIEHLFFPLVGSSTDIPGAMAYGLEQLTLMASNESLRMHTMFSDGVSNCSHRGSGSGDFMKLASGKYSLQKDTCKDSLDDPDPKTIDANMVDHSSPSWGDYAYGNHIWSLWEASALASREETKLDSEVASVIPPKEFLKASDGTDFKTYQDLGIKFNFVAVGEPSLPHTIVRQSATNPDRCMTDGEARKADEWYVHFDPSYIDDAWENYNTGGTPKPYALATTYMYYMTKETDGFYFPVRTPCNSLSGGADGACKFGGVSMQAYLDGLCKANYRDSTGGTNDCPWGSGFVYKQPFTDTCGRLTCDPQCKSVGEQVDRAMTEMLSQNPFVLVTQLN